MAAGYVYHDLAWAPLFRRSCRAPFRAYGYRGRCELRRGHDGPHAAERGMEWVRWDDVGAWLTTPGSLWQGRLCLMCGGDGRDRLFRPIGPPNELGVVPVARDRVVNLPCRACNGHGSDAD